MVDSQMLSVSFDRGESAHGHTADSIGGEQLSQLLALIALETEPYVLKGSFLRAKSGSLMGEDSSTARH